MGLGFGGLLLVCCFDQGLGWLWSWVPVGLFGFVVFVGFVLWFIAVGFRGWYWLLVLSVWLVCWFAGFAWLAGFLYLCGLIVVGLGCGCLVTVWWGGLVCLRCGS